MTDLRLFRDLDDAQRDQLYAFTATHDPERFPDAHAMVRAYASSAFEHGETQFSLWHEGTIVGTMAAVIREASLRGETFLTAVAIAPGHEALFPALLDRALGCMPPVPELVVRMGIQPSHRHLEALVAANGFAPDYDGLVMTYDPAPFELPEDPDWRLETVDEGNREPYRQVLDDAFRHSPNGATVDAEQITELMAEIRYPDLLALAWSGDQPAAAYELDIQGDTGWIEALAVARPLQGHGFGKRMLKAAIARLEAHGAKTIKLLVMSANEPAVKLYRQYGFGREHVTARWWRLAR